MLEPKEETRLGGGVGEVGLEVVFSGGGERFSRVAWTGRKKNTC